MHKPSPGLFATPVGPSEDLTRIIALPRRAQPEEGSTRSEAMIVLMTDRYRRPRLACACASVDSEWDRPVRPCITKLNHAQAHSLYEIGICKGLFAPIRVGHGKTIIDILAPLAFGAKRAVVLVPSNVVEQFCYEYCRVSEHFRVPSLRAIGSFEFSRDSAEPSELWVVPYSILSQARSAGLLERLQPDLIFADEADKLCNVNGAGSGRVMRYLSDHLDKCRFGAASGSFFEKEISDCSHISAAALREGSPLPLSKSVSEDWGRCVDATMESPAPPGALKALALEGEPIRKAFQRRILETRGVIVTGERETGTKLLLKSRQAPPIPEGVSNALRNLRDTWQRPDGEELIDALSVARCAVEIACGFFHRWIFPEDPGVEAVIAWKEARRLFHKELRSALAARKPFLDSELLLRRAAARFHGDPIDNVLDPTDEDSDEDTIEIADSGPAWDSKYWPLWRDVRSTVVYESQAVWISDYLARDCAQWALENKGIVWYENRAFGLKVSQLSDLPLHSGGPNAARHIARETGDRSIVASIRSHGRGRDGLQRIFSNQLVAQPPANARAWEQLLGRLDRLGQTSPTVTTWVYSFIEELTKRVEQATDHARFASSMVASPQKLLVGSGLDNTSKIW